jgi:pimeloyl-ACP methyl ester carboxylesterase
LAWANRHRRAIGIALVAFLLLVVVGWVGENAYAARWIATHCGSPTAEGPPPPGARDVTFGQGLHAWYTPPSQPQLATLIMVHGYQGDRRDFGAFATALEARGYGTFRIELPCAHSDTLYGGGNREASDATSAVRYVASTSPGPRVLFGFSGGGTSALLAADRGAPVAGVITDSAPSNLINITHFMRFGRWFYRLTPVLYPLLSHGGHLVNLEHDLTRPFPVPALLVQGTGDTYVNPGNGPRLAALTHGELWTVSGANHGQSYQRQPAMYLQRVIAFIDGVTSRR